MKTETKDQLEEIFLDVRKAYRLLYHYQRRVMDTIQFIADSYSKRVVSGYSLFSSMPPKNGSSINLNSWAWDWLPIYCYEFYFGKEEIKSDVYQFAIAVYSDSGYDDSAGYIEATEVQKFAPVGVSKTQLYFYLGKNMWKPDEFDKNWSTESADEQEYGNVMNKFISKRFDLSDFVDEESITNCIQQFRQFTELKGLGNFFA